MVRELLRAESSFAKIMDGSREVAVAAERDGDRLAASRRHNVRERVTSDIDGHHHHDPTHSAGRVPAISRCFLALLHRQVSVLSAVFAFVFALWALTSAGGEPTTRKRRHANGDSDVNERERDFAGGPVSLAVAGGVFGGLLTSTAALLAAVVVKQREMNKNSTKT